MTVYSIQAECPVDSYYELLNILTKKSVRKSDMQEIENVIVELKSSKESIKMIDDFLEINKDYDVFNKAIKKTERAYKSTISSITKPSYIDRLTGYPYINRLKNDNSPIDQIERATDEFTKNPRGSYLSMVVFHPDDMVDYFRPGYVPCLSFIDIKYRNERMSMKFIFRTFDAAEVGILDFYNCLKIQSKIEDICRAKRPDLKIRGGNCVIFFSRCFYYKRRISVIDEIQRRIQSLKKGNSFGKTHSTQAQT